MKIEIEVTADEIKAAIEKKVRAAIFDQTTGFVFDAYVKDAVKAALIPVVKSMIEERIADAPSIEKKITEEIERKIKAQINALMRAKP